MPRPFSKNQRSARKVGLLGGSFNPAHEGHRAMSVYALKRLGLDEVWWLVSPQNPLKSSNGMAPLRDRLKMAQKLARHPRIFVTDLEAKLGTVYTADTLKALCRLYPLTYFVWLMGADNLQQIGSWKNWPDIFTTIPIAVFRRPAYGAAHEQGRGQGKAAARFAHGRQPIRNARLLAEMEPPAWLMLDNPLNPVSATQIRKDTPQWLRQKRK